MAAIQTANKSMESPIIQKEITCKKCGEISNFTILPIINFQNKELVEKTFSLDLFTFICPKCGAKTLVQYDTLVIDLFKKNLIYLFGQDSIEQFYKEVAPSLDNILNTPAIQEISSNLKHTRLVKNLPELREKLLIFDYDLDDRVIEMIKYSLYQKPELIEFECLNIFFNQLEKDKLIFDCISKNPNNKPKNLILSIDVYNNFIDQSHVIPEEPNFRFDLINDQWLKQVIELQQKQNKENQKE